MCSFEALQLSLKNKCKLRPLLGEAAAHPENLQEIDKSETPADRRTGGQVDKH